MSESSSTSWFAFLVGAVFVLGVMSLGLIGANEQREQQVASLQTPQIEAPRLPVAPPDVKPAFTPPSDLPSPGR